MDTETLGGEGGMGEGEDGIACFYAVKKEFDSLFLCKTCNVQT